MVPQRSRRRILQASVVALGTSIAGCMIGSGQTGRVDVDFSGTATSEKPFVKNAHLSIDGGASYPNYYKALVTSRDELRWEYLVEEKALLVDNLNNTSWESEYLAIFGMVLPRDRGFNAEETTIKDGTLTKTLILKDRSSGSSALTIMNHITRIKNVEERPKKLEVSVVY